jgi:hypothetical protein
MGHIGLVLMPKCIGIGRARTQLLLSIYAGNSALGIRRELHVSIPLLFKKCIAARVTGGYGGGWGGSWAVVDRWTDMKTLMFISLENLPSE